MADVMADESRAVCSLTAPLARNSLTGPGLGCDHNHSENPPSHVTRVAVIYVILNVVGLK